MGTADLELSFPPLPQYVRVARHVVGWMARMRDVPEPCVDDVRLLASEACTNAMVANQEAASDEPVVMRAGEDNGTLTIEVLDRGSEPPRPIVDFEVDTGEMAFEKGTWLAVVQGVADDWSVEPRDGGGSSLKATLYF